VYFPFFAICFERVSRVSPLNSVVRALRDWPNGLLHGIFPQCLREDLSRGMT